MPLFLRLRDWSAWAVIIVESHLLAAPPPVKRALRDLSRLLRLKRWIRID
ncbi:hypothetical protein [Caulobacter sp. BK020]|nr:hypothetical protein [Caulobacter sp. BK020]